MISQDQRGAMNVLILPLIFSVLFLIAAIAFGGWAYSSRQDFKNNTDAKIAIAVAAEKTQESTAKDQEFAQEEKNPLKTYNGPQAYGSLIVNYPKTWSSYVDDTSNNGSTPIDGYFYPGTVPSITSQTSTFALRIQVLSQSYSQSLQAFSGQVTDNMVTVSPYALPKVPSVVGVEVTGAITSNTTGTMVILPLRNTTLEIWTEGTQFISDFNSIILANLSFSP